MELSSAAEEAFELAMEAAKAIEEAGKNFGPQSEESRLARLAYRQWMEEYQDLTSADALWEMHCRHSPEARGCGGLDL